MLHVHPGAGQQIQGIYAGLKQIQAERRVEEDQVKRLRVLLQPCQRITSPELSVLCIEGRQIFADLHRRFGILFKEDDFFCASGKRFKAQRT